MFAHSFLVLVSVAGCALSEPNDSPAPPEAPAIATATATAELEAFRASLSESPELAAMIGPPVAAAAACPAGCYEANVACTGFLLWNTCWCPSSGGGVCPVGGWWVGGACFGGWLCGCEHQGCGF